MRGVKNIYSTVMLLAFSALAFADEAGTAHSYVAVAQDVNDAFDPTTANSAEEARAIDQASLDANFGAGEETVLAEKDLNTGEITEFAPGGAELAEEVLGNDEDSDDELLGE